MTITFVCTGNTCRSPMAEAVARRLVETHGPVAPESPVVVRSAGTAAWQGAPASEGARRAAAAAKLDLESHRSAWLTPELVAESDVIACMGRGHVAWALGMGGGDRVRLFRDEKGSEVEVADPFGGGSDEYVRVLRQLEALVGGLLAGLFTEGFAKPGRGASYVLLGDPVAHSLSPAIHNAAFRAAGRRAVYWARPTSAGECGNILRAVAQAGGGGNVTAPLKEAAARSLDAATGAVAATGACNAFWAHDGVVHGDNTDVEGFVGTWKRTLGAGGPRTRRDGAPQEAPEGPEVLVLGAGGAARGVVHALLEFGLAGRIELWNRTARRAERLAERFAGAGPPGGPSNRVRVVAAWQGRAPDVVVNATAAGMDGRSAPIDLRKLAVLPSGLIDLVYGEALTPLVRQARAMGVAATDGRDMLARQAEASYRRWFGEDPPAGVMAGAVRRKSA